MDRNVTVLVVCRKFAGFKEKMQHQQHVAFVTGGGWNGLLVMSRRVLNMNDNELRMSPNGAVVDAAKKEALKAE